MNGFALTEDGDLLIENNQIKIVSNNEQTKQKVRSVLKTNINEWFLNLNEGIDFSVLLGKYQGEEAVRSVIQDGLSQIDSSFYIEEFSCDYDRRYRKLTVKFKAKNAAGEEVGDELSWA